MDIFDLAAKITLDTTDYETAVKNIKKSSETLEKKLSDATNKVSKLRAEYAKSAKETGTTSEKTKQLAEQLKKAEQNVDSLKSDLDKLKNVARETGRNFDELGNDVKNGFNTAKTVAVSAVAAIGAAVVGLGKIGLDYNSQMESYTTNFKVMLGDTESAVAKVEELKIMAAKTPFGMEDLAKNTQTLLAFGIASEDTSKILTQLGDISLGDKEKLNSLTLAFAQSSSAGKLAGQDLLQMINAGFNPLQQLTEETGLSVGQLKEVMAGLGEEAAAAMLKTQGITKRGVEIIRQGQITAEDLVHALDLATQSGGQFYNGMQEASQTTAGLMSTLEDNVKGKIGEAFTEVSEIIKTDVLPAAIEFVDNIDAPEVVQNVKNVLNTMKELAPVLIGVAAAAVTYKTAIAISSIIEKVTKATKGMTIAKAALNVVMKANPVALLVTALAGLTVGLVAYAAKSANAAKNTDYLTKEQRENIKAAKDLSDAYYDAAEAAEKMVDAQMADLDYTATLMKELDEYVDESGNVKEEHAGRVKFILDTINGLLGTEYELTGLVLKNYEDIEKTVEATMQKKRAETMLSGYEETYTSAKTGVGKQQLAVLQLSEQQIAAQKAYDEKYSELETFYRNNWYYTEEEARRNILLRMGKSKEKSDLDEANKNLAEASDTLANMESTIANYEKAQELMLTGNIEEANAFLTQLQWDTAFVESEMAKNAANEVELLKTQVKETSALAYVLRTAYEQGIEGVTQAEVEAAEDRAQTARENLYDVGGSAVSGIIKGLEDGEWMLTDAMSAIVKEIADKMLIEYYGLAYVKPASTKPRNVVEIPAQTFNFYQPVQSPSDFAREAYRYKTYGLAGAR